MKQISKGAFNHIKQQYEHPKWDQLRARIRKDGWQVNVRPAPTSSSGSTFPGNLSAATLDPKPWTIPVTFTNLKASSGTHALFDSTLYDNCVALHVVNSRDRLEPGSFVPSDELDYLEAATTSFKISGRGTRVMRNVLNGVNGERTEDLTLLDVAVVEGFHVNIVSESRLKMKDAWYCGFDCTMRFGPIEKNTILAQLVRRHNIVFIEYTPLSHYLPRPPSAILQSPPFIFSTSNTHAQAKSRRQPSRHVAPPRIDTEELWHLCSGHLGKDALIKLVENARGVRIKGTERRHFLFVLFGEFIGIFRIIQRVTM
ncbi:hypothetical protein E4U60_007504, partial [Claviceps pazoutovae]